MANGSKKILHGPRLVGVSSAALLFAIAYPGRSIKTVDFAADVQPILKARCVSCHVGPDCAAGLALDTYANLMASKTVVPGQSDRSRLIERVLGHGGMDRMPLNAAPLKPEQIVTIRAWIDGGARPPANDHRKHWAYVAPFKPAVPAGFPNPIDGFVAAGLRSEHLRFSPEADRPALIRRVTLDLTGLPPTPEQVDAFVADRSPNAYERVVDRLLKDPHFGEKMALPWLDAARYADSNGFQQDGDTHQWVWRDWVVRALNADMPFDEFTTKQLAGDLLPNPTHDDLIATAFNRNHMLNGEGGAIAEEQRNVVLFDRVDTTATTWLGLTMTCARCHDHKYDPLTQRDYFGMMAFFNNVPESGVPSGGGQYRIADPWIFAPDAKLTAELRPLEEQAREAERIYDAVAWAHATEISIPANLRSILSKAPVDRTAVETKLIHDALAKAVGPKPVVDAREAWQKRRQAVDTFRMERFPRVMVMSDARPRVTHILFRGDYLNPRDVVEPSPPSIGPKPAAGKLNRLDLARWITSAQNPLTARVEVNRLWQTFFGRGLVRTPENFGIQGESPTHPELLDWLAVDFRESGWKVKRLIRMIVTSRTYRQSSKASRELVARDPDNRLLARGARFRLPSLLLRDVALASSGLIDLRIGGRPVYPYQPKGIWDGLAITLERDFTYPQSTGADLYRRSLYTFWRRTVAPGNMFDASARQTCTVRPSLTSTPMHALTTLNDVTWNEAARALAEHAISACKTPDERLVWAFRRVCARRPDVRELGILRRALERASRLFAKNPKDAESYLSFGASPRSRTIVPVEHAAFTAVCLAILNLDEALTRE